VVAVVGSAEASQPLWPRERRDAAVHAAIENLLDEVRSKETELLYASDWSSSPRSPQGSPSAQGKETWRRLKHDMGDIAAITSMLHRLRQHLGQEPSSASRPGAVLAAAADAPLGPHTLGVTAAFSPTSPGAWEAAAGAAGSAAAVTAAEGLGPGHTLWPLASAADGQVRNEVGVVGVFEALLNDVRQTQLDKWQIEGNEWSTVERARSDGAESWKKLRMDLGIAGAIDMLLGEVASQQMENGADQATWLSWKPSAADGGSASEAPESHRRCFNHGSTGTAPILSASSSNSGCADSGGSTGGRARAPASAVPPGA